MKSWTVTNKKKNMLLFRTGVCVCVCAFSLNQVLRQSNQYHFYNDCYFTFLEMSLLKCAHTLHVCKQHEQFDLFLSIESWSFTGSHINLCSITFSLRWMTLNNNDDDEMWLFRRDILLEFENNHRMNLVQKHSLCKQTKYSFHLFSTPIDEVQNTITFCGQTSFHFAQVSIFKFSIYRSTYSFQKQSEFTKE